MATGSDRVRPERRKCSLTWNEEFLAELLNNSDADISDVDDDFTNDYEAQRNAELAHNISDSSVHESSDEEADDPPPVLQGKKRKKKAKRDAIWRKKVFPSMDTEIIVEPTQNIYDEPETPLTYFSLFFPNKFFEETSFQTNLYSAQTRDGKIVNTTPDEIRVLSGIHLFMGTFSLPQIRMYWSCRCLLPIVANSMTRDRFIEVRNLLHFTDNSDHKKDDTNKMWKVQPLLDTVRQACLEIPCALHCSIDEQMIPFSGRCPVRQYLPSKPNPVGLKNFVLAASDGAVLDFLIYQGKYTVCEEDKSSFGHGGAVVKKLVETLPKNDGSFVYTDRYFTGINIADYLQENKIYLTGTVMSNRTMGVANKMIPDKELVRGAFDEWVRQDEKMGLLKWKDKKSVLLLSTAFGSEPVGVCKRWNSAENQKTDVPRPAVVARYNSSMGGVDLIDRYISYYRAAMKTKKWTLRVFAHFLDLAVCNSWILYNRDANAVNMNKKDRMTLIEFRMQVAEALVSAAEQQTPRGRPKKTPEAAYPARKKPPKRFPIPDVRYDGIGHLPKHISGINHSRCRMEGCKGKSRFQCIKCGIFLCILKNNCFLKFHQK